MNVVRIVPPTAPPQLIRYWQRELDPPPRNVLDLM